VDDDALVWYVEASTVPAVGGRKRYNQGLNTLAVIEDLALTTAQDIAALKRAVKDLERRMDSFEGPSGLEGVRQEIRDLRGSNDIMFKLILRQLEDTRTISDQRHTQIVALIEKLQTKPPEN